MFDGWNSHVVTPFRRKEYSSVEYWNACLLVSVGLPRPLKCIPAKG